MSRERPVRPAETHTPDFNYATSGLHVSLYDLKSPDGPKQSREVTISDIPHTDYNHESYGRV